MLLWVSYRLRDFDSSDFPLRQIRDTFLGTPVCILFSNLGNIKAHMVNQNNFPSIFMLMAQKPSLLHITPYNTKITDQNRNTFDRNLSLPSFP